MHPDFAPHAEALKPYQILLLPGYGDSGPEHWLTHWEHHLGNAKRVVQDDWERPDLEVWTTRLHAYVEQSYLTTRQPILLVGHSMGCLLASYWLNRQDPELDSPVKGALLVAPPDIQRPDFPETATRFDHNQYAQLSLPTTVLASSNDPYCSLNEAKQLAQRWGSELIEVGDQGHINSDSRLGNWTDGLTALVDLAKRAGM